MSGLRGATALITGAGNERGIGHGIARRVAGAGANVVVTDLAVEPLHDRAAQLAAEFDVDVAALPLDVTDRSAPLGSSR